MIDSIKTAGISKILVVKTHALGDVLMVTPCVRALKELFPQASIHFLTSSWSAPAIETNPNIDKIVLFPDSVIRKEKLWQLLPLIFELRRNNYDLAVIFQPSKLIRRLIQLSSVKCMGGVHMGDQRGLDFGSPWRLDRDRYVGKDFFDLVRCLGAENGLVRPEYELPSDSRKWATAILKKVAQEDGTLAVICPAGGRNPRDSVRQKIWPSGNYAQLAKRLMNDNFSIVVSAPESERMDTLWAAENPDITDLTGRTTFSDLAALIAGAGIVVTNDSAAMHLGFAFNTPTVPIFGPSRHRSLIPENVRCLPVTASIPCAPCYDNEPFPGCENDACIQSVSVEAVHGAVLETYRRWINA